MKGQKISTAELDVRIRLEESEKMLKAVYTNKKTSSSNKSFF
ncbi:MAG: hypothetical protein R2764_26045 [Bacteroidales bacterium]